MNETTREWEDGFEDWQSDDGPVLARRHRVAMVVGVAGILGAMTTAMLTAHAAPRFTTTECVTTRAAGAR